MADSRRARRLADPSLQPERTSLAWLRTLLGYGALLALALRQKGPEAGIWLWGVLVALALVIGLLWHYARQRNLMDVAVSDFTSARSMRARLIVALAVVALSLLFVATHLRAILKLLS